MTEKPIVLVVACALVDTDNRVLVTQRPEGKALAGLWEFPGGKLEAGERPEPALIRELAERFGAQCVVLSVDARRESGQPSGFGVTTHGGRTSAGLDALAEAWEWTSKDVLAQGLPLFHVHGLILGVLGPLRRGGALIHTQKPTPERYAEAARAGATMFFGVPTVWTRIAADPVSAQQLSSARLLVSGSAPLPIPVFDDIRPHIAR